MTSADLARDAQARTAVVQDRDSTLFVEAGAGSGKTSCLVDRFVALVESGVAADRIAAITFTEKAAAELVDRIRSRAPTARTGQRDVSGRAASAGQCRHRHTAFVRPARSVRAPYRGGPSAAVHGQRRDRVADRIRHALGAVRRRDAREPGSGRAAAACCSRAAASPSTCVTWRSRSTPTGTWWSSAPTSSAIR